MVQILDATLREGEQTPGVHFDRHIKLQIAKLLDEIGIDFIEAGHPMVTQEIYDAVHLLAHQELKATVAAHSRSVKKDVDLALECGVQFIGIFYCVSDERLTDVFKKDLSVAIGQISEVIRYAKEKKPDLIIRYTPEDTVRSQFENVLDASAAAVQAGADIISVADTTGYMIPGTERSMYDFIKRLRDGLNRKGLTPKLAVHCHNDRGLAVANALDAYRAGVDIIDVTVQGLGERAGLVDMGQLLSVLTADFGEKRWNLEKLTDLYELVSRHSNIPVPANFPVTGKNAFTHCAGVHTHAASIDPMHYESLTPQLVGRERHFSLDHMSGLASVKYALDLAGMDKLEEDIIIEVLNVVKIIGQRGRTVELEELPEIVEMLHKRPQ